MTKRLLFRKLLNSTDFFKTFAKHLDEIFPNGWIYDIEEQEDVVCAVDSSAGWREALCDTCIELNIYDVYQYWTSLSWEESDILDGEISELLCAVVYDENNRRV